MGTVYLLAMLSQLGGFITGILQILESTEQKTPEVLRHFARWGSSASHRGEPTKLLGNCWGFLATFLGTMLPKAHEA